jgi:hypothetical protein
MAVPPIVIALTDPTPPYWQYETMITSWHACDVVNEAVTVDPLAFPWQSVPRQVIAMAAY